MKQDSNCNIASLIEILKQEADFLTAGKLNNLEPLNSKKQDLIERIAKEVPNLNPSDLEELKAVATSNLRLINAAKKGVTNVRKRLDDLARVSSGTHTYGSDGARNQWTTGQPKQDISY